MKITSVVRLWCALALLLSAPLYTCAQDTSRISLQQAEQLFINKNLELLAARYDVSIAQAQIIQARLYNNPQLAFSGAIINPQTGKVPDWGDKSGQYDFSIQQLILLAGKRNKQVQLAQTGAAMAENRFFDLLRTLRYTLRSDFYKAFYLQQSIRAYDAQIGNLQQLVVNYDQLQTKGAITLKDAVRIKSLLYSLSADRTDLLNQLTGIQSELQLLLQDNNTWFIPEAPASGNQPSLNNISLVGLIDTAYHNRFDLKLAQNSLLYDQQNYRLQKALAVPDLTLGAEFDKRSNYIENATLLNAAIDLPFFNRNQGNIKAAKLGIDQSKTVLEQQTFKVENEVKTAYTRVLQHEQTLGAVDPAFRSDFDRLLKSITDNFLKKNISLLEFTDFYDSYRENILQLNQLQSNRLQAIEDLNYALGKTIFNN